MFFARLKKIVRDHILGIIVLLCLLGLTGCASSGSGLERLNAEQASTIHGLNREIARLNEELDDVMRSRQELAGAMAEMEKGLKDQLAAGDMSLAMDERGLIVTVQDNVLFDSGKAEIKDSARRSLDTVADILDKKAAGHMIHIEGHTDNEPIRYSGWRSNWELSTARSTEVVHYFIEQSGLNPVLLAAVGYSEYQPVMSNASAEGRSANRRVEIVISPRKPKQ